MAAVLPSQVLIVGTGSLASLFAARLAASGCQVTMLGSWQSGLGALAKHGVRIRENGVERAYHVSVTHDPRTCAGTRCALVLVKSWGTMRAAGQLSSCLAERGIALTLQNGLGNQETLESALGAERVGMGITTYGANLIEPGFVRPAGSGTITLTDNKSVRPIGDLLEKAGFSVAYTDDASSLIWGKLVVNASINPLTALLEVTNGELLQRPSARALMGEAALETAAVAETHGIQLSHPDPVSFVEDIARRTAANRSSMLQDITRGSPTEIDAINGAIVNAAAESGVPAPINRTLWQLIKSKEKK